MQRKLEMWLHDDCNSMGFFVVSYSVSLIKKGKICLGFEELDFLERQDLLKAVKIRK